MRVINKLLALFILSSINVSLIGCNYNKTPISKEWMKSTNSLIELGYEENNLYTDFVSKYTDEPDPYETLYMLQMSNIISYKSNYSEASKNYIVGKSKDMLQGDLQDLICLYKLYEQVGLPNSDNEKAIEKFITQNDIIGKLKNESELTDEAESLIFMLADIKSIIPDFNIEDIRTNIEKFENEIINSNEKLYILNPIDKLIGSSSNEKYKILKSNIVSRVDNIVSNDYMYIWEIYNLIEFSTRNNICTKDDYNILVDKASINLFQGENKVSNMKMLYLIKCYNIIDNSLIDKFKDPIINNIKSCELIKGGYTPQTSVIFPDDYTYLAIYSKNSLDYSIKNETLDVLYYNISNEIVGGTPNWKSIYRFLELVNNKDFNDKIINLLSEHGYLNLDKNVDGKNIIFYYLTVIKLNYKIDDNKLNNYITEQENSLKDINSFDDIRSLYQCYYYSELIKESKRTADKSLVDKIKNLVEQYKNPKSNFYKAKDSDNLLYTFLCISIQKNLGIYNKTMTNENFYNELKNYIIEDGGLTMVPSKEENPSLHSTTVGIMLEKLMIENKEVPAIL